MSARADAIRPPLMDLSAAVEAVQKSRPNGNMTDISAIIERLTASQWDEIALLIKNPRYGGSDRQRDRKRTALKKIGLLHFDRKAWSWVVHPALFRALAQGGERG